MASHGCPCGCDARLEALREQRLAAVQAFEHTLIYREFAQDLQLGFRHISPEEGWSLTDVLGAPMRADETVSSDYSADDLSAIDLAARLGYDVTEISGVLDLGERGILMISTRRGSVPLCERHSSGDMHWCITHDALWPEEMGWCEGA